MKANPKPPRRKVTLIIENSSYNWVKCYESFSYLVMTTADEEDEPSPDMVAVILGEVADKLPKQHRQQGPADHPTMKEKATQPEQKPRVPPPPSAKVSEELLRQRNAENREREQRQAWEAWEKAQKVYLKQQQMRERKRPTVEEDAVEKDTPEQEKLVPQQTETTPVSVMEIANPLTPPIPGDETVVVQNLPRCKTTSRIVGS